MWSTVDERRHNVIKVFPARFQSSDDENEPLGCEMMLFGEVTKKTTDGSVVTASWAGHAVLKKDDQGGREEWKFAHYQVWL